MVSVISELMVTVWVDVDEDGLLSGALLVSGLSEDLSDVYGEEIAGVVSVGVDSVFDALGVRM